MIGPCAPNKKDALKGELTLRTSVFTYGSKDELAVQMTCMDQFQILSGLYKQY